MSNQLTGFLSFAVAFVAMIAAASGEPVKATHTSKSHRHHERAVRAQMYVLPAPAVEVQPWSDGRVDVQGWCFIPDPEYRNLGHWRLCGVY